MYTVEKKYLCMLGATTEPVASQSVDVPLLIDEPSQQLALWVYSPGKVALGAGSVAIYRNGELLSTTPFAGNSLFVPLGLYKIGADFEMEMLHPQTTVARAVQSVFHFDPISGAMVEDKEVGKYGGTAAMPVHAKITNADATRKNLVVMWSALVWRNA